MDWLIPCNIRKYDVTSAFSNSPTIDWRQSTNVTNGDFVYIYCGKPLQKIMFKTQAILTDIPYSEIDHSDEKYYLDTSFSSDLSSKKYMRLKLIDSFYDEYFCLKNLINNGLTKAPQGPMKLNASLSLYCEEKTKALPSSIKNITYTKIEALENLIKDNNGVANWKFIYNNIEKYYPTVKQSNEWQAGLRGVLYRGIKQGLIEKLDTGLFSIPNHTNELSLFPESADTESCIEGAKTTIQVNKYERSSVARQKCIDSNGCYCHICGLNFPKVYGEVGKDFIHVHHIIPLNEISEKYIVDPINDLIPVCPNCHAMLHRKVNGEYLTIDELKNIIYK